MNHSPLKTALAYECFPDQDNSTLALPSDQKMKTGTSGRQRVQEQVMMTVKRQKSKSSQSSTLSHSNRGSMYDGLADNYNNYGTTSRSSYYSKFQAGNGSWGYPIYNGTLKRENDNRRFSSYSQMENWGRHYQRGSCNATGAGSDICFMQKIKASRSEVQPLSLNTEGPSPSENEEMKAGVPSRATGTGGLADGHSVSGDTEPALQGSEPHEPPNCSLSPLNDRLFIYLTNIH
uniref:Plakophilin 1 n=1 Tax=Lynx canadensis TaxID=61383 RepID=A0A667I000_LYNCA